MSQPEPTLRWRIKFKMADLKENMYLYDSDKLLKSKTEIENINAVEHQRMIQISLELRNWLRDNGGTEVTAKEETA
jgi:hypothetical protein